MSIKDVYDQSVEYKDTVMDDIISALTKSKISYNKKSDTEVNVTLTSGIDSKYVANAILSNIKTPMQVFNTLINFVNTNGVFYIRQVLK